MRRFLDDVRDDINNMIVSGGGLLATELAPLMIDMIDSTIQDESALSSVTETLAQPIGTGWTPVAAAVFDTSVGGDAEFLKVSLPTGSIETASTAGFTYRATGLLSFQDIGSNVSIEFSILKNGQQAGFIAAMTGGGNNRARSASFQHVDLSAGEDDLYTIGVRCPDGVQDIDIISIGLGLSILPTNNA